METEKTSPFIRGIQDRLDAIFGEDQRKPVHGEGADPMKETAGESERSEMPKDGGARDPKVVNAQGTDKTPFVRGIENRLDAIFEEYGKKPDHREGAESGQQDNKTEKFEQLFGELATSTSIMYSPLKDLKSMVLSIEWEVTDQGMEKFDTEVNKLSVTFAEDKIILGFLKILRFLGMYIRVKGVDTHHGAVKLLMSVYDSLEKALLTKDISDAQKHELLCGEVKKYNDWVQTVDLTAREDVVEREEAPMREEPPGVSKRNQAVRAAKEAPSPAGKAEMTPHEAFAFALEEIKKVISAEFNALRAELKLWRQDK